MRCFGSIGGVLTCLILAALPARAQDEGRALLEAGKYVEAEVAFRTQLEDAPGNLEARLGLASAQLGQGKFQEAEATVDEVRRTSPDDPRVLLALARVYFTHANELRQEEMPSSLSIRTRYNDTVELCTRVLALDSNNLEALRLRGDARFWLDDAEGAASDYATALKEQPTDLALNASLGDLYLRYLGRVDEAIPYLEKAVGLDPDLVEARRNLAHAYRASGNLDRAVTEYLAVLERNPSDQETFDALWEIFAGREKYEEAEAVYARILEANPDNLLARWHRANLLALQGRTMEATEVCRDILQRKPEWVAVRNFLANLELALDRRDEAVKTWLEAWDAGSGDSDSLAGLLGVARAYGESREYESSLAVFDEIIRRVPDDAAIRADRALTLYNLGRTDEAIQAYTDAVEIDPYDSQILNDLGLAYQGTGDYQKAIEYFLKAIEIDNNPDAQENYGVILMKLGETGKALNLFEKILATDAGRDRSLKYYLECRRKTDMIQRLRDSK